MRDAFRSSLLVAARGFLGTTETSWNSGTEIDEWLKYARSKPGNPWCAAGACFMHRIAAVENDVPNPCPRTASVQHMLDLTLPECRIVLPAPGCVFFLKTKKGHHCGIVEVTTPDGNTIVSIEFNTNAAGSREGNTVARHTWKWRSGDRGEVLGFADYSELVPLLPPSPFK